MLASLNDTFTLTVVRVASGGNTGGGKYFYSFSPEILMARQKGFIHFELSVDSSPNIKIFTVVDSAGSGQMAPAIVDDKGLRAKVYDNMTQPALISMAVVVTDEEANEPTYIVCDPQVINVPD